MARMTEIETGTLALEPILHSVRHVHEPEATYRIDAKEIRDRTLDRMVWELHASVYAEKVLEREQRVHFEKEVDFWFPRSPWHHFKHRHVEAWWMAPVRWLRPTVQYERSSKMIDLWKTVRLQQFAKFPETKLMMPEDLGGKQYVRYETSKVLE